MRIFSRVAFIFNIGFLIAMLLQVTDASFLPAGVYEDSGIHPAVVFILILYFLSGLVNFLFFLLLLFFLVFKKDHNIPKWILYFNLVIMVCQAFYFFII